MSLKVDSITNAAGTGSPNFPQGITVNSYALGNSAGETISSTSASIRSYSPSANITVIVDSTYPQGKELTIIHAGSANLITLRANNAGQTIATIYPGMTYKCIPIVTNPANTADWVGLTNIESQWIAYIPTVSNFAGSLTTNKGFWRRRGDSADITIYNIKDGTVASGALQVTWTYPTGLVPDITKFQQSRKSGLLMTAANSFGYGSTSGAFADSSFMYLLRDAAGNGFRGSEWTANTEVEFEFYSLPIVGWSQTKG
jgi:hypothetical protein